MNKEIMNVMNIYYFLSIVIILLGTIINSLDLVIVTYMGCILNLIIILPLAYFKEKEQ